MPNCETTEYLTVTLFQCLHLHWPVHTLQFVKFDAQLSQMVALQILVGELGFSKNDYCKMVRGNRISG